ncbi:biotin carboxylase N-terminal domain-containing protein [Streptomyces sp. NPDC047880]|uniref:biotin carboxylase N-terminal domain-containing protein n=1 Tax=Streptomyces sp. NPDC047880 TaxID=3155626 RepID=UPI0034525D9B
MIAVRVIREARELDLPIVALRSRDEGDALHVRMADEVVVLDGEGSGAFLDAAAMVETVVRAGCAAVHPGHGLLAENADFAQRCTGAGLTGVGPRPKMLRTLGDTTAPVNSRRASACRCRTATPAARRRARSGRPRRGCRVHGQGGRRRRRARQRAVYEAGAVAGCSHGCRGR